MILLRRWKTKLGVASGEQLQLSLPLSVERKQKFDLIFLGYWWNSKKDGRIYSL